MIARLVGIALGAVMACLLLELLRSIEIDAESRGMWTGAFGILAADVATRCLSRRRAP